MVGVAATARVCVCAAAAVAAVVACTTQLRGSLVSLPHKGLGMACAAAVTLVVVCAAATQMIGSAVPVSKKQAIWLRTQHPLVVYSCACIDMSRVCAIAMKRATSRAAGFKQ